jgi:hypothetical protein
MQREILAGFSSVFLSTYPLFDALLPSLWPFGVGVCSWPTTTLPTTAILTSNLSSTGSLHSERRQCSPPQRPGPGHLASPVWNEQATPEGFTAGQLMYQPSLVVSIYRGNTQSLFGALVITFYTYPAPTPHWLFIDEFRHTMASHQRIPQCYRPWGLVTASRIRIRSPSRAGWPCHHW